MLDINTWADDMYPLVLERFQDRLNKRSFSLIKSLLGFKGLKTSNQYATEGIGGYGLATKYNGSTIPEASQKRGYKKIYTPEEYVRKASIGYKFAKVDPTGEAQKAGNKMADTMAMTLIREFYNLFANGWNSGAEFLGADGVSLFSDSHPVNAQDSETFSNTGTSTFSVVAITATQTAVQRWKTYDGQDFDCNFNLALISPELEPKAKEFWGKEAKNIPESAENGANPISDFTYQVIKGFSAKQWAIADSFLLKEYMKLVEITAPMVIKNQPDNPLIQEFIGYMDNCLGWDDPRCIFGHNP